MTLHASPLQRWWPSPLRLFLGIAFLYHGWPKLFSAQGHLGFAANLRQMGIAWPDVLAWFVGALEVLGGLALLIGIAVSAVSTLLIVEMLVAMVKVHLPHGFAFVQVVDVTPSGPVFGLPGAEVNLLYIAALLALLLGGPGPLSFESWNVQRREHSSRTTVPPREAHA
ncbi:MAG TPA: DoxX family protein [Anaeromyxobacteraceae bacterium]|nr:DoxX family protein [Anaeromyxobacteraceae bacterium]